MTPLPAHAGAWIAPEGGQEIWSNVVGEREGLTFYGSSGYYEAPVGEATSAVFAPWYENNYGSAEPWRAEAKYVLHRSEGGTVVAFQGAALWTSAPGGDCGEGGAEFRALARRGFGRTGFVNVEAATRALSGSCESERLDLTLGYRPGENWLAMGQVFADVPRDGEEAIRAQVTRVYFRHSGRGVQIGLRTRVDGGAEEVALVIGLWGRPGD